MSEPLQSPLPSEAPRGDAGFVARIQSRLSSLKFALGVVVLIALACSVGTLIPQGESQVAAFLSRHPAGGRVMQVLSLLGLTRVFQSWWFVGLLFAFAASLMACTARRYALIRRTTGAVRARVIGSFITHVSLILVLVGGVVRVLWGQKGMVQLHQGEVVGQAERAGAPMVLPFSVRLAKFELEFHETPAPPSGAQADKLLVSWEEKKLQAEFAIELNAEHPVVPADAPAGSAPAFKVTVLRYLPDFYKDAMTGEAKSRSREPNNPAVLVSVAGAGRTNTQWVFERFPDFGSHGAADGTAALPLKFRFETARAPLAAGGQASIKAFKSTLDFLEEGAVVDTRTIEVNAPYAYRGYTFYQVSYDPNDLTWSALQVVKDPGVPIVYSGFFLMMAGLTLVFCVGPWLAAQPRAREGMS